MPLRVVKDASKLLKLPLPVSLSLSELLKMPLSVVAHGKSTQFSKCAYSFYHCSARNGLKMHFSISVVHDDVTVKSSKVTEQQSHRQFSLVEAKRQLSFQMTNQLTLINFTHTHPHTHTHTHTHEDVLSSSLNLQLSTHTHTTEFATFHTPTPPNLQPSTHPHHRICNTNTQQNNVLFKWFRRDLCTVI